LKPKIRVIPSSDCSTNSFHQTEIVSSAPEFAEATTWAEPWRSTIMMRARSYLAVCSCGWRFIARESAWEAERDADVHMLYVMLEPEPDPPLDEVNLE
jgi:hypothetical protein